MGETKVTKLEMELSQSVLEGLALAGDAAHVPDKNFSVLVTRALDGLLDERHRHMIASKKKQVPARTSYSKWDFMRMK